MGLPLYKGGEFPKQYEDSFNAGLWYNKFCNTWDDRWLLPAQEKLKWINGLVTSGKQSCTIGSAKFLAAGTARLRELVMAIGGRVFHFETETRFVIGLGLEHPVENGFLWHVTLGVPYIPGTGVKGLVRSWVEEWIRIDNQIDAQIINRIFGPSTEAREGPGVGSVIFFDAIPVKPVLLEADVMTPHYGPYYRDAKVPPGDWHSPTPIPFLTVAPGRAFMFAVAPRSKDDARDLQLVSQWLEEALVWVGMGAKTAIGYGRFKLMKAEQAPASEFAKEVEVKEEAAVADPILQEMIEDGYQEPADTGIFLKTFDQKWKLRLLSQEVPLEEKRHIARLLDQWYWEKSPEQRRKPNKKNKEKLEIIKEYLI